MDDLLKEVNKRTVLIKLENIESTYKKSCKICQEDVVLGDLIAHEKSHLKEELRDWECKEGDNNSFSCIQCDENFHKETLLNIHKIQKHSASLVVYLEKSPVPKEKEKHCRKLDFGQEEKKPFVNSRPYKCRYCEKSFVLASQCKSHENAHVDSEILVNAIESPQSSSSAAESNSTLTEANFELNGDPPLEAPVVPSESLPSNSDPAMEQNTCVMIEPQIKNNAIDSKQMPKLVAPIKLVEPFQFQKFSNITNLGQDGVSFLTSTSFIAAPIKLESDAVVTNPSIAVVKQESDESEVDEKVMSNGVIETADGGIEKSYKCLQCAMLFPESEIFPHIKTHLVRGQKECTLCDYKAIASGDLRDHMNKHYNLKPYKCTLCNNSYGWQSGWKKHKQTHDKDSKPFQCSQCKLRFDTQRERRRHELIHQNISGPSPKKKQKKSNTTADKNSEVGYNTYNPAVQQQHHYQYNNQQNFNNTPPYPSQEFHQGQGQQNVSYYNTNGSYNGEYHSSNTALNTTWDSGQNQSHLKYFPVNRETWTEEKPAAEMSANNDKPPEEIQKEFREPDDIRENETCKECNQVILISDLPAHILSHIVPGQKSCTICKYKCNTRVYLEEHYNIHYGLKPYTCTVCKRKFAMRSYLRSHTQQVHESESTRRYQCRYCNKRFVRPCHMKTHEKIHEGQGEVLPVGESSTVDPALDCVSDCSSSNSNISQRAPAPAPMTPERHSLTSSPLTNSPYQHQRSHSNSPQLTTMAPVAPLTPKSDPQWMSSNQSSWSSSSSYWSGNQNQYASTDSAINYEINSWNNNYQYYPLADYVKSDVNWTEPLSNNSSPWQQQQLPHSYSTPVKSETIWGDSSSSGFHSSNTSSNCPSVPPSATVQDLWSELHCEEMKWFPETSTIYTADGIPMITEFAPFDNCFSYTDMLNSATADLPLFGSFQNPTTTVNHTQISEKDTKHLSSPSEVKQSSSEKGVQNGPRPGKNLKGRGKGRLTAEAKHKLKMNFVSTVPEGELDGPISQPSSPKESDDASDTEDPEFLVACQTCRVDVPRSNLLSHIRGHLIAGQRTCDLCQRTYCNPLTLREHIHVHYNLKPHKCSHCPERFSTKYSLKTHEIFTHDEGKVSQCPYPGCVKVFAMRSELHKHVKTHENKNGTIQQQRHGKVKERRSTEEIKMEAKLKEDAKSRIWEVRIMDIGQKMTKKCPFCNEEILLSDFFNHKYSHRDPCHICGKPVLLTEILYHGPTHVGSDMKCEVCGWKAQQRSQLWEHINGHMKVKPIRCLYCGVGFASRNSLRSHYLALHTNFRPHSCRFCEKKFVQGNTLKQHEMTHFGTQCPACQESFTFRKDLKLHLREVHKFDY